MDAKARIRNRVGNADLYIGMVRKRKSLPRDSKGFEPIEQYLKEVDEDLNQSSNESGSGEETDVEEEKRREEQEREAKRRVREQERERRRREEEARKAEVEKARQREAEREIIKERELRNKPSQKQRVRGQRMSTQQVQRRSLRQQGIASDSDDRGSSHSATDTEEAAVVTTAVDSTQAPGHAGSDHQATESGSDREGGGRNREKKKVTTSKRGRPRKSAVSQRNTAAETTKKRETVNEVADEERESAPEDNTTSTEEERLVGEGGKGGEGRVASNNLYSPEAPAETSPLRDTFKLGPVRLTFSASPSDDERRRQDVSEHHTLTALAAGGRGKNVRRTFNLPRTETATTVTTGEDVATVDGSETDGEDRYKTTIVGGANGSVLRDKDSSSHPKKTSTKVKGGGKRSISGRSTVQKVSGRKSKSVVRSLESDSEDGGAEEEDQELMTLLEPSIRVPRLMGLGQLTQSRRSRGGQKPAHSLDPSGVPGDHLCEESTDEEEVPMALQSTSDSHQPADKSKSNTKKSGSRATTISTKKEKHKSSRKSVAFNPHTTNLGSPELPPPNPLVTAATGSQENAVIAESDTGGSSSGVYDYVPSDEEDYSHTKSRLYSPRRKSILRKAASMKKNKTTQQQENKGDVTAGNDKQRKVKSAKGTGKAPKSEVQRRSIQVEGMSSQEQWFVPDELSMHKMISEKSPHSLRRLTRSGKSGASDQSTSHVVAPTRKRQQRPRELDSTVHSLHHGESEDGSGSEKSTGRSDSASQNVGVSSDDEGLVSSTDPKRQGSESGEVQGKIPRSNKRSSRSAKLTPPWIQNKRTRKNTKSDLDQEEDEGEKREESTPASKKLRVSLPTEEDEGMQSGGAMFLSSSEEDDEANLVRSLGGRRYRRYTVQHQDTKTPGVRRSKRTRLAPVQHWRNEELEYERRRSGVTLRGVLVPLDKTSKRPSHKGKAPSNRKEDGWMPPQLILTDKDGIAEQLDIVTHSSSCDRINGEGETASHFDDLIITKLYSSPSTTCGLMELRYLGEKERSKSTSHEVLFFVLKGRAQFLVNRQQFDLSVDMQVRIPAGVTYAVKNVHRGLARLYFYSHQIHRHGGPL